MHRVRRARRMLSVALAALLLLTQVAGAQGGNAPGGNAPGGAAPGGAAPGAANPIDIRLEIYVVSLVTRDDGTREERFAQTTEARPGQTVEYRLFVANVSEQTLPAGIVTVLGPVPEGTEYVPNSATASSDDLLTEFSADRGRTFSEPPIIVGTGENRTVADPTDYDTVRWTVLVDLEPEAEVPLVYRVIVR